MPSDPNRRQLSLHLPANVERALRDHAAGEDRTLSKQALKYIREGLHADGALGKREEER